MDLACWCRRAPWQVTWSQKRDRAMRASCLGLCGCFGMFGVLFYFLTEIWFLVFVCIKYWLRCDYPVLFGFGQRQSACDIVESRNGARNVGVAFSVGK